MAHLNLRDRVIETTIAYVGAEERGGAANLAHVKQNEQRGRAGALGEKAIAGGRVLSLDWRPRDGAKLNDCELSVKLVSADGPVDPAAMQSVLVDADGLVLVLEAAPDATTRNARAVATVREALARTPEKRVPVVVQVNQTDGAEEPLGLEALSEEWPRVSARADRGDGVMETLKRAVDAVVESMQKTPATDVAAPRHSVSERAPRAEGNPLLSALRGIIQATVSEQIEALERRMADRLERAKVDGGEVAAVRSEIAASRREAAAARDDAQAARTEAAETRAELVAARGEAAAARSEIAVARADAIKARDEAVAARGEAAAARAEAAAKREEAAAARAESEAIRSESASILEEVTSARGDEAREAAERFAVLEAKLTHMEGAVQGLAERTASASERAASRQDVERLTMRLVAESNAHREAVDKRLATLGAWTDKLTAEGDAHREAVVCELREARKALRDEVSRAVMATATPLQKALDGLAIEIKKWIAQEAAADLAGALERVSDASESAADRMEALAAESRGVLSRIDDLAATVKSVDGTFAERAAWLGDTLKGFAERADTRGDAVHGELKALVDELRTKKKGWFS
ncbi:MAG TPA: hypothetical protein VHV30_01005 [Polyangiaceae bacterium]|nr:hypothetical protein [Polyangiaceae bacterium]